MTRKTRDIPRRSGRPSRESAEQISERILEEASSAFLTQGYGATSIEGIAQRIGISKRTLYHRFDGKAALFAAVLHRLVERLRPTETGWVPGSDIQTLLAQLAQSFLKAALTHEALALYRLMISETGRFPELTAIMDAEGARREAIGRIGTLLRQANAALTDEQSRFAAEQFLHMIVTVPQRRALGLGALMDANEEAEWIAQTVRLFLRGIEGFV